MFPGDKTQPVAAGTPVLTKQSWEQRFAKCCPSFTQEEEEEVSSGPAAGPSAFLLNNRAGMGERGWWNAARFHGI